MDETTKNPIPQKPLEINCYKIGDEGWDIVPASSKREWMEQTNGHAHKCLPLLSANQMGWHILSPTDFTTIWDGSSSIDGVKVFVEDEKFAPCIRSHFGYGTFTFQIPYLFRTSEEIGLFARGATNFWIENAHALDGFIETNWSNYSFTMNWKMIRPNAMAHFRKGDPICMLMPYPIRLLESVKVTATGFDKASEDHQRIYREWSKYRDAFNANKNRPPGAWQKDYFMGRKCPFSGNGPENIGDPHRTKFHLPRFDDASERQK